MAQVAHHRQVVGDEQVAHATLLLEVQEEVEDLPLDRDIEGGDRLIADDELGLEGKGAGDADTLELPAGERGRAAVAETGVDADPLEELVGPAASLGSVVEVVDVPGLGHDLADREARVDRGERVLVDQLDVASHPAQLVTVERQEVLSLQGDAASVGLDEPQEDPRQRRLARARFAHQTVRFTWRDGEVDVLDGADDPSAVTAPRREGLAQAPSIEKWFGHDLSVAAPGVSQ
jgi:hypothetical protein